MTFDEIRENHPELAVSLYAITPRGPVTFEVITEDGTAYQFQGPTAQEAIDAAFPSVEPAVPELKTDSVFD